MRSYRIGQFIFGSLLSTSVCNGLVLHDFACSGCWYGFYLSGSSVMNLCHHDYTHVFRIALRHETWVAYNTAGPVAVLIVFFSVLVLWIGLLFGALFPALGGALMGLPGRHAPTFRGFGHLSSGSLASLLVSGPRSATSAARHCDRRPAELIGSEASHPWCLR